MNTIGLTLVNIGFGMLVFFSFSINRKLYSTRILKYPIQLICFIGINSYSIYLCHGVVFMVFNSALPKLLPNKGGLMLLLPITIYIVSTLLVAHFMYKLVEIPAQAYLKKKWL